MTLTYRHEYTQNGVRRTEYYSTREKLTVTPSEYSSNSIYFYPPYNEEERKLRIFALGHELCPPDKKIISRSYKTALVVHYITGGSGSCNGSPMHKGQCVVNYPGVEHTFITDPSDPIEMCWILLDGSEIPNIIESCRMSPETPVFDIPFCSVAAELIRRAVYEYDGIAGAYDYFIGYLRTLLSYHRGYGSPEYNDRGQISATTQDTYLANALRILREHRYALSISELSAKIGISSKYLSRLYKDKYGGGFKEYITSQRIETAKNYILYNPDPELQSMYIATGYSDYVSFSRAFKNYVGMSPRQFIKHCKLF